MNALYDIWNTFGGLLMKRSIFALLTLLAALYSSSSAFADDPIFTLRNQVSIGTSPDGKPVTYVYYYNDMLQHFQYICFLTTAEGQDWPKEIELREDEEKKPAMYVYQEGETAPENAELFIPSFFYRSEGFDTNISWNFASDGASIILYENSYDIYDGEGWNVTKHFIWTISEFSLVEENRILLSEKATREIEQALALGDARKIIDAVIALGNIQGREGSLLSYPPERLILPLWRFFHSQADQHAHDKGFLPQFLEAVVYYGGHGGEPTLEGFLEYSLALPGTREHIEACATLLESAGEKEKAAVLRKILKG